MKTFRAVFPQLFLCFFISGLAQAANQDSNQVSLKQIKALEAELASAKQDVARLEAELANAKQQLAGAGKTVTHREISAAAAVTRITSEQLQNHGIHDATRLAQQVPGMLYGQSGNEARFAMRGTHTNRTGPESDQILAIYEDGVPVVTTTQALGPYVDVREIEVLRGPQGVMYGRNAFGGAVAIHSNEPDLSGWDAALQGSIAFSDFTRFEAMLNMPVSDSLAVRLVGASESVSGYVNNLVLESDADDLNGRIQQYARLSARWQPGDDFSLQLNFASLDQNGTGSGIWGYQQVGAMIDGSYYPGHQFAPAGGTPDHSPWTIARNMASSTELENLSTTLTLDWNLGFATLEWLANTSKFESMQIFDADYSNGGNAYNSDFNGWDSFMDTVSSDLRLSSNGQGRLDWIAGVHILSNENDWGWLETRDSVQLRPEWDADGLYTTESTAVYASTGFRVFDNTRVFGGLRWYEDQKQLRSGERGSWDGVLWNAGVEHGFSERTTSYLRASTGYRPGGINPMAGVPAAYDSEQVTAIELGFKTLLAHETLSLDAAAFFNDYSDMQAQSFTILPLPGTAGLMDYLSTAGDKESKGLEIEMQWQPEQHWNIAAQFAWLDAQFKNYSVTKPAGLGHIAGHTETDQLRLDGWQPAFSPEWSLGMQASYLFDTGRWGTFRSMLQTSFTSDYYTNDFNLPGALQKAHLEGDIRFFWDLPGDKLRLQFFIENFTNKEILNATTIYNPVERPDIATFLAAWGDPRKYGLTLSYHY
ncbi:MAG: TonB-dependent receptor plug domain-containing protein [Xanthomonadales bacterium]|nr:TonB-dependent receptor plug domain-containing protein [Xanthomonadales bacterium]